MDCFQYPLDTETLLRKKRRLRRELLAQNPHPLHKKIASSSILRAFLDR